MMVSPSSSSLLPHFELPCFFHSSPRRHLFPPWPATSSRPLRSTEAARDFGTATLSRASSSSTPATPPFRPKAAGSTSSPRTSEERCLLPPSAASPTSPERRLAVPSSSSALPPRALSRPHLHVARRPPKLHRHRRPEPPRLFFLVSGCSRRCHAAVTSLVSIPAPSSFRLAALSFSPPLTKSITILLRKVI